jgi:hypothetical protein
MHKHIIINYFKIVQMKRVILSMLFLSCMLRATAQNVSLYWSLSGNNNASTSSRLGTTNSIPLRFFTQNLERIRVDAIGRVGIIVYHNHDGI